MITNQMCSSLIETVSEFSILHADRKIPRKNRESCALLFVESFHNEDKMHR